MNFLKLLLILLLLSSFPTTGSPGVILPEGGSGDGPQGSTALVDSDGDGIIDVRTPFGIADFDGDGMVDSLGTWIGASEDYDYGFYPPVWRLEEKWRSPETGVLYDTAVGDLDNDGLTDIAGCSFNYNGAVSRLRIFENDSDDHFNTAWVSTGLSSGAVTSLAVYDADDDGFEEIYVGQYTHTVHIFENTGDDDYGELPSIDVRDHTGGQLFIRKIRLSDTNVNGEEEVIVLKSSSAYPNYGWFSIFENGEQLFLDTDESYFWRMTAGCFDTDGYPDILVSHGNGGNWLDWYEYDGETWVKKELIPPVHTSGHPILPEIADVDLDGENELLVAGRFDGEYRLMILKSYADDEYELAGLVTYHAFSTPMDMSIKDIAGDEYPEIGICTHNSSGYGKTFLFSYNGATYDLLCETGEELEVSNSQLLSIDLAFADRDGYPDIFLAAGPLMHRVIMLEKVWVH